MEQKSRIMFTGMSCFSGISYGAKQHRDAAEAELRWGSESLPQFLNHLSPLQEFFGIQSFRELLSFFSTASREFLLSDHSPGKKSGNLLHLFLEFPPLLFSLLFILSSEAVLLQQLRNFHPC